jgi:hypothetical protein
MRNVPTAVCLLHGITMSKVIHVDSSLNQISSEVEPQKKKKKKKKIQPSKFDFKRYEPYNKIQFR